MAKFRSLFLSFAALAATETVQLTLPDGPTSSNQLIDGSILGYSIEIANLDDFAGSGGADNPLSNRMLNNLRDITGSPPSIRIGGTTANHATYDPNQQEPLILNFATPGADQPANFSWGPSFLQSFRTFPAGTKWSVGVTFNSGKKGENETVSQATGFFGGLGQNLSSLEVGNEFDVFPVDRNATTWSLGQYVSEWLDRTSALKARVAGLAQRLPFFSSCVFVYPGEINPRVTWTPKQAIDLGILSTGVAQDVNVHQYFGAACGPTKFHKEQSEYAVSKGVKYVIGETNSIACQGLAGVSDIFASSIWAIDYILSAASTQVSKMYFHQGTAYRYAAWQPVQNGTTAPGPRPLYYGHWLAATALGNTKKQVVIVINEDEFSGYAIYSPGKPHQRPSLKHLVLLNFNVYNATATPGAARSSVEVQLPTATCKGKVSVKRLTAGSVDAREGLTFAGQSIDLLGNIVGKQTEEKVKNGVVSVKASEAVLVSF